MIVASVEVSRPGIFPCEMKISLPRGIRRIWLFNHEKSGKMTMKYFPYHQGEIFFDHILSLTNDPNPSGHARKVGEEVIDGQKVMIYLEEVYILTVEEEK